MERLGREGERGLMSARLGDGCDLQTAQKKRPPARVLVVDRDAREAPAAVSRDPEEPAAVGADLDAAGS